LGRGDALFECNVLSYPVAQITWKKNNKKLSDMNKKFRIIHGSNNVGYLRVTDANSFAYNNVINITCIAENDMGTVEATSHLHIIPEKDRPKNFPLVQISNPKSVEPDVPFRIECNITNHVNPLVVKWYQSNKPINFDDLSSSKYFSNWTRSDNSIHRHILYVKGISLTSDPSVVDSAQIDFMCSATNSIGTQFAETSVLLRSKLSMIFYTNEFLNRFHTFSFSLTTYLDLFLYFLTKLTILL